VSSVRAKYLEGGYGYGHAKAELLEILIDYLSPYQRLRTELLGDISFVEARLEQGASIMNARLEITLEQVRRITGV
jgi:tryptophanyl-tRNA synthetase